MAIVLYVISPLNQQRENSSFAALDEHIILIN